MFLPKYRFAILISAISILCFSALAVKHNPAAPIPSPFFSRSVLTGTAAAPPAAAVPNRTNPGVVDIQAPELAGYKRIIAVSDVHGQYVEIWHLLLASGVIEMVPKPEIMDGKATGALQWRPRWRGTGTLLIVAGDSIDKGPQSLEVLKLWYDLQAQQNNDNNRILLLLGNHEAEYLANPLADKALTLHQELIGQGYRPDALADSNFVTHDGYPLGRFIRTMPLAARVGQWLFCHAGWIPAPSLVDAAQTTAEGKWSAFVLAAQAALRGGHYASMVIRGDDETEADTAETVGPLEPMLEKKTDSTGRKWWKKEIPILEARLTEYGLYGVVFGHQPKAFGIEDGIGLNTPQDAHLVKIDSGMAVPGSPTAEGQDAVNTWPQPYVGHLLQFPHPAELAPGRNAPTMESLGFGKNLVTTTFATPEK